MTSVTVKGEFNVPADTLWNALKGFDLNYLPGFPHTVEGSGVGATRKFNTSDGETAERIEAYDPANRSFSYTILYGALPVQDYHATVRVLPGGEQACALEWSAVFEPKGAAEEAAREAVERLLRYNVKSLNKFLTA